MKRLVGTILLLAMLSAVTLFVVEDARWPDPAQVPAIVVPQAPLPADQQAWKLLKQACQVVPDKSWLSEELRVKGPPDARDLAAWKTAEAGLDRLDRAMESPGLSIPTPDTNLLIGDVDPDTVTLQWLSRAPLLRGWDLALNGDIQAGVTAMGTVLSLGQRLLDADTHLLPMMVGLNIQNLALRELQELLDSTAAGDRAAHAQALQMVAPLLDSPPALPRALAYECNATEKLLRGFGASPSDMAEQPDLPYTLPFPAWTVTPLYNASMSVMWHRLRCSDIITQASTPFHQRREPENLALWPSEGLPSPSQLVHYPASRVLYQLSYWDYMDFVLREDMMRAHRAVLAVTWAARLHAFDHGGRLPAGTADLVPQYLERVPADPFGAGDVILKDGQVWSLGDGMKALAELPNPQQLRWSVATWYGFGG